jgi:hypothetical protein
MSRRRGGSSEDEESPSFAGVVWSRLVKPRSPSYFNPSRSEKANADDRPLATRFWAQRISTWLTFLLLLVPLVSPPVAHWALMTVESSGQSSRSFVGTYGACDADNIQWV